jgi:hypothetical protein
LLVQASVLHHAVLYTSHNLILRQAYFDQENELAFLGNFLFILVMHWLLPHSTYTHTCTHAHTSLSLFLSVFLASKCLAYKLNLFLSPAQPAGSQVNQECHRDCTKRDDIKTDFREIACELPCSSGYISVVFVVALCTLDLITRALVLQLPANHMRSFLLDTSDARISCNK